MSLKYVRALDELEAEPQVGLVGTEPAHRLGVGHPRQRGGHVVADQRPQRGEDLLGDRDDVFGVDEAHLHVQLGELGLAVGAEIFVAVAPRDLVVALHPGHHQQLLEQLRALRQRVERAGLQPRRHQEVARALGRRAGQCRRLDLDEVVVGQHLARGGIDLGAQPNCRAGPVAAQIQVAVLQPRFLTGGLIELERQRRTLPQHGQRCRVDLDLTGGDLRVRVALGPDLDDAVDGDAELRPQPVRLRQHVGLAEHHLRHPRRVAQVDEDDAAVVAATRHPTGQGHLLPGVGGPQRTGGMTAQHENSLYQRPDKRLPQCKGVRARDESRLRHGPRGYGASTRASASTWFHLRPSGSSAPSTWPSPRAAVRVLADGRGRSGPASSPTCGPARACASAPPAPSRARAIIGDEEFLAWEPYSHMAFRFNDGRRQHRRVRRGLLACRPLRLPPDLGDGDEAERTGAAGMSRDR